MERDVRSWNGRRTELVAKLTRNNAFNLRVQIQFKRNECERKRWVGGGEGEEKREDWKQKNISSDTVMTTLQQDYEYPRCRSKMQRFYLVRKI
jgi:hypothetical protein